MTETALFVIGFGIFGTCLLATVGMAIGTSQPQDSEVSRSGPDHPE
ncbi:MAG: hypothetical protein HQ518_32930 [Rhodopirellula sp.]|jgi:hypothetical protein|nr:hypothetical protein [Rhodopirellula sp.]